MIITCEFNNNLQTPLCFWYLDHRILIGFNGQGCLYKNNESLLRIHLGDYVKRFKEITRKIIIPVEILFSDIL